MVLYGAIDEGVWRSVPAVDRSAQPLRHSHRRCGARPLSCQRPAPISPDWFLPCACPSGSRAPGGSCAIRWRDRPLPTLRGSDRAVAGGGCSTHAPVLIIVDDLHWADKPTLLMLMHLHRSLADAAGAVRRHVPGLRGRGRSTGPRPTRSATLRRGGARVAAGGARRPRPQTEVVESLLGDGPAVRSRATRRWRAGPAASTGTPTGNPLFVAELLPRPEPAWRAG